MSNKIYFPLHFDSGNRGCEAIARGTIDILRLLPKEYIALPKNIQLDRQTELNEKVTYAKKRDNSFNKFCHRVITYLLKNKTEVKTLNHTFEYRPFLSYVRNELTFITGGDMLCYGNNEVNYITDYLYSRGKKVVLWGCSVGKENLTPEKEEALKQFSCITTRESLTYDLLKNELHLPNVHLFPDPAFVLIPEECELPEYFSKDVIGINLSNFVGAEIGEETIFGKNILSLFDYILNNTQFDIVLMPHVFWKGQDDRISCNYFYDRFKDNHRVHVLNTEEMNYCQIRYAISKCKLFLGARTHAMISAYSTCVPSIALGYSIKSKGIAKDLNLPAYTVLDYRNLMHDDEIVERFKQLQDNEAVIRKLLKEEMPSYIKKAYDAKKCIDDLKGNK